jgi:hypothetical protein
VPPLGFQIEEKTYVNEQNAEYDERKDAVEVAF